MTTTLPHPGRAIPDPASLPTPHHGDRTSAVLVTGSGNGALEALARQTGGRSFSGDSDVAGHLSEIRNHPPAPTDAVDEGATVVRSETPGIAVLSALVALVNAVTMPPPARSSAWPALSVKVPDEPRVAA